MAFFYLAIEYANKADVLFHKQKYSEAASQYLVALKNFRIAQTETDLSDQRKTKITAKQIYYEEAMDRCMSILRSQVFTKQPGSNKREMEENELKESLSKCIFKQETNANCKLEDVVGLDAAKSALQEAMYIPLIFPELISDKYKWSGILLFGGAGTGKSFMVYSFINKLNAMINESGKKVTVVNLKFSQLFNKYAGQTEKSVQLLFEFLREKAPSVLLIDEIDSLCNERTDEDNELQRRVKNFFLSEMTDSRGFVVIGTTNMPEKFDAAFLRRFQKRIYIPLPNLEERKLMCKQFFEDFIKNGKVDINECELIARRTEGYSGSDLKTVFAESVHGIFRREYMGASYFGQLPSGEIYPCRKNEGTKINLMDITQKNLVQIRDMTIEDVMLALEKIKSTNSAEKIRQIEFWAEEYATDFRRSPYPKWSLSYNVPKLLYPCCWILECCFGS